MSSDNSLHSKLVVLVAKLYKAEKLYSGMRPHPSESKTEMHNAHEPRAAHRSSKQASIPLLAEYSNEIRSSEWFRVHNDYRNRLNRICTESRVEELEARLEMLHELFLSEFEDAEFDLYEAKGLAREAIEKEEFSYLLKISSEILRRKSRLQAMKVIYDELENLAGLQRNIRRNGQISDQATQSSGTASRLRSGLRAHTSEPPQEAKVIPLMRKASY